MGEGIINLYLEGFQNPQGICNKIRSLFSKSNFLLQLKSNGLTIIILTIPAVIAKIFMSGGA